MKNRSSAVAAGVASAGNAAHKLKFTVVRTKGVAFTGSSGGDQETVVNSAGKTIGFDVLYEKVTGQNSATVDAAFLLKGGLLYATATTTNGQTFKGKVTGGTRAFKGATGTFIAEIKSSKKTAITITYNT